MKARCKMLVELYDPALRGQYVPGQILEGELAEKALFLYPDYFEAIPITQKAKEQK